MICDDTGPISLAAVMGGETSEVRPSTVDVLFEAAHWDPVMIARTCRRHKLHSEASKRWERGVDRELALPPIEKAVRLLVEHGGGTAGDEVLDFDTAAGGAAGDHRRRPAGAGGRRAVRAGRAADILREIGCAVAVDGTGSS